MMNTNPTKTIVSLLSSLSFRSRHRQLLSLAFIALGLIINSASASAPNTSKDKLAPLDNHYNTTRNIVDALAGRHYVNTALNDDLSEKIFKGYLDDLDPSRSYFLASDIASFEKYRFKFDDALQKGDVSSAFKIFNVYHKRVVTRFEKVIAELESGIANLDLTIDENLILDRSEEPWAKNNKELDTIWNKRLKNAVLNLRLSDKKAEKIQELLVKRYKNRLSATVQTNSEDVYQLFMNAFTQTYDPHTQYFSPRTSENFNINMSLSLEGIGAVLQREDDYTKVVSLVPKGPADKSKSIFPDDKIIAVGQGESGEMVDVIGWRLDEVVQLIRGKKDSTVRLDVIPSGTDDANSGIIQIVRNTVKLEEQSAKSEIIEIEQFGKTQKIGVIDIPTFYFDYLALQQGKKDFNSTTRDVKNLVVELMQDGVAGIIIDLRNNGGGSLQEAKTLTGLFIDSGPTVQIRNKSGKLDILYDRDIRTIYDGPLAVLVNRLSASASEIFAGAIQDYERGIIVGSQTFGKGTVQTLLPVAKGQLKLTAAKFYRISGESTQHKGIIPDITFPSNFDPEAIGESTLDEPLPWDRIQTVGYRSKRSISPLLNDLRSMHNERASEDPEFNFVQEAFAYRQERSKLKSISLNEQIRRDEKKESDAFWLALENKKRSAQGLALINSLDDMDEDGHVKIAAAIPATKTAIPPSDTELNADQDSFLQNSAIQDSAIEDNSIASIGGTASGTETQASSQTDDIESKVESEDEDKPFKPDAFLAETGNIVLDMTRLEKRIASRKKSLRQI